MKGEGEISLIWTVMTAMLKNVLDIVKNNNLIQQGDSVLAGVSGGADSVCLLDILHTLQAYIKFRIAVVHFNHGLRKNDADKDAGFVKKLAKKYKYVFHNILLPVKNLSKSKKLGIEEAARMLRYRALEDLAAAHRYNKIALGHHRDDQAETVLFRIIRGTGLKGIAGIPLKRKLKETGAVIIRPLLAISKKKIISYLKEKKISYRTDLSNASDAFTRNKIRNKLIPYLERFNPHVKEHCARLADMQRSEEDWWQEFINKKIKSLVKHEENKFFLDLKKFNKYHIMIRKKILLYILPNNIDFTAINAVVKLGESKVSGKTISIPGCRRVEKSYNTLIFYPEHKKTAPAEFNAVECIVPGRTYIPERGYTINLRILKKKPRNLCSNGTKAYSDWDKLKNKRFTVRSRTAGDRFFPFGLGAAAKLKDFFISQHVPRQVRETIPLVCAGDAIVWVVGYRTDDRWKVTKKTKHILEMNIEK